MAAPASFAVYVGNDVLLGRNELFVHLLGTKPAATGQRHR